MVLVPKKQQGGVCVADRFRGIALTSVVCKIFCHILKERLATVVEEFNLVVDEQGGFRRGRGCRDQISIKGYDLQAKTELHLTRRLRSDFAECKRFMWLSQFDQNWDSSIKTGTLASGAFSLDGYASNSHSKVNSHGNCMPPLKNVLLSAETV